MTQADWRRREEAYRQFGTECARDSMWALVDSQRNAQQDEDEPGHAIGKVSTDGDLIVMELDAGAMGKTNLFDLTGRTLRFAPEGSRYRVQTQALQWDKDFGPELAAAEVTLHQFVFPFSGQHWKSFRVAQRDRYALANRLLTVSILTAIVMKESFSVDSTSWPRRPPH